MPRTMRASFWSVLLGLTLGAFAAPAFGMGWNDVLIDAVQKKQPTRALDALEKGAKVDAADDDGYTALYYAVKADLDTVVQALLEGGAEAHAEFPDGEGATILHVAAREGSLNSLELLIAHGADPAYQPDTTLVGHPLYEAAISNQAEVVRALCKHGVDPNIRKMGGQLPLVSACAKGHIEVVRALLECGADPSLQSTMDEMDAYFAANRNGNQELIDLLKTYGRAGMKPTGAKPAAVAAPMPMWMWGLIGLVAIVVLVMSARASNGPAYTPPPESYRPIDEPAAAEPTGKPRWEEHSTYGTIAPEAAQKKQPDSIPGLATAAEDGDTTTIHELLGKVTSLGTRQKLGAGPLALAAEKGHAAAVAALLGYGVPPDAKNADGVSVLALAVLNNHPAVVAALLDRGATFGPDRSGATLLALAAEANALDIAKQLLKHGADSHVADEHGRTPGQIARAKGFEELARLLGS